MDTRPSDSTRRLHRALRALGPAAPGATRRNPPSADPLRDGLRAAAGDPRLSGLPAVMTDGGRPLLLYRGTQREAIGGVRPTLSFTSSLGVALIWSAVPPDPFSSSRDSRVAHFVPASSVHAVHLAMRRPLAWEGLTMSLYDVLVSLRYGEPDGITVEEVGKVYNYLHNRITGKAKGGEFRYEVVDEDGEPVEDESGLDFSGRTRILDEKDLFMGSEDLEDAGRLQADAFIFADAPAVVKAATRLGFDGIIHADVFAGGTGAAPTLLGLDVEELDGVEEDRDIDGEWVPSHRTWRPFSADQVVNVARLPSAEALDLWRSDRTRSNPSRPTGHGLESAMISVRRTRRNSFGVPVEDGTEYDVALADVLQWGRIRYAGDARQSLVVRLADGAVSLVRQDRYAAGSEARRAVERLARLIPMAGRPTMTEGYRVAWIDPVDLSHASPAAPVDLSVGPATAFAPGSGRVTVSWAGHRHVYYRGQKSWRGPKGSPDLSSADGDAAHHAATRALRAEALQSWAVALARGADDRTRSNPRRPAAVDPLSRADWVDLPAGTVLHHGTATAEDFAVPRGPAWFSDGPKVAERFARGSTVRPRVISYRTARPLRLLRLGGWPDLYDLGDRIWPGWSDREEQDPREVASHLCGLGLDGWWLDDGDYGVPGADVMLCRPGDALGDAFAARGLAPARASRRAGSGR